VPDLTERLNATGCVGLLMAIALAADAEHSRTGSTLWGSIAHNALYAAHDAAEEILPDAERSLPLLAEFVTRDEIDQFVFQLIWADERFGGDAR